LTDLERITKKRLGLTGKITIRNSGNVSNTGLKNPDLILELNGHNRLMCVRIVENAQPLMQA